MGPVGGGEGANYVKPPSLSITKRPSEFSFAYVGRRFHIARPCARLISIWVVIGDVTMPGIAFHVRENGEGMACFIIPIYYTEEFSGT